MTSAPQYGEQADPGVCYRHPDRQSWILCQRCGRTICPQCQTQAAVGVQCPDCVREGHANLPKVKRRPPAFLRGLRPGNGAPVVTYSLLGVNAVFWVLQFLTGGWLTQQLIMWAPLVSSEPWRMITSAFIHSTSIPGGIMHILFNSYALFAFGAGLEQLLGRWRYLALYLIGALGGSVAVVLLSPTSPTLGASGAVFALFGAYFIVQRHLGGNTAQILILIGINLAIGFFVSNVSWQAHVGGVLAGAVVGLILTRTRQRSQRPLQIGLLAGFVAVLVAITAVRIATFSILF